MKAEAGVNTEDGYRLFDCRVCGTVPKEPVATPCGHICCYDCFEQATGSRRAAMQCPACGTRFEGRRLTLIYTGHNDASRDRTLLDRSERRGRPSPLRRFIAGGIDVQILAACALILAASLCCVLINAVTVPVLQNFTEKTPFDGTLDGPLVGILADAFIEEVGTKFGELLGGSLLFLGAALFLCWKRPRDGDARM
eukprot:TRINITY_DN1603_c0_g2_i1.p1 TRINITY_DN1603_c0_g2~~TRINITY_DN1603_c0_g2_i1.p1  ORF type:complete len:196 (+),score=17.18 TRINITY_DN1603_c0_g2_i1:139-726(+)